MPKGERYTENLAVNLSVEQSVRLDKMARALHTYKAGVMRLAIKRLWNAAERGEPLYDLEGNGRPDERMTEVFDFMTTVEQREQLARLEKVLHVPRAAILRLALDRLWAQMQEGVSLLEDEELEFE